MAIQAAFQDVPGEDGKAMPIYVARPEGAGPFPGLVVIMEIFGANDHMQAVTRRFAEAGYVAACPDFFYRLEERTKPYSDMQGAFAMRNTLHDDKMIDDIGRAVNLLKQDAAVKESLGIIGYCMGGRFSYLAAARMDDFAAASIYYGGGIIGGEINERVPAEPITLASQVACPVQGLFGADDQSIPVENVDRLHEALKATGVETEFNVYDGAGHGFFCDDRGTYNAEASKDAWDRTMAFFTKHL